MKMIRLFRLLPVLMLLYGNRSFSQENINDSKNSKIVSPEWLSKHIDDSDLVIIHVATLKLEYDREHIPGARFLWTGWLTYSTPEENTIPRPVEEIKRTLESLGISNNSRIVLTSMNGLLASTCRVFVTLDYLGFGDQTCILNGGVEKWKESGGKVTSEVPRVKESRVTLIPVREVFWDTDKVLKSLKTPDIIIIDARSALLYEGKSGTPRAGHIPGARNLPISKLYTDKTFLFNSPEKLREEFSLAGATEGYEVVTYCSVGSAASVVYFLARELGFKTHLYDGSMDEWINRFYLPLE